MNELQKNGRNESTEVDGRVASESMDVEADVLVLDRLEGALGAIHEMPGVQESSTSNARASYADMVSDPSHNVSKAINQDELTPDRFILEYEALQHICLKCGIYGHAQDLCPKNQPPVPTDGTDNVSISEREPDS
ncbi:hypothetical protein V6N13_082107 [Hibiscus sabdariffa]